MYSDRERSQHLRDYVRLDWPDNRITGTPHLVWDDTTFVWSYSTDSGSGEIRGTFSPNGSTILSLTASETHRFEVNPNSPNASHGTHTWRVEARNVSLTGWNEEGNKYAAQAAYEAVQTNVGAHVIKIEDTELQTYSKDPRLNRTGPIDHRTSLVAPDWSAGGGVTVHFEKQPR